MEINNGLGSAHHVGIRLGNPLSELVKLIVKEYPPLAMAQVE